MALNDRLRRLETALAPGGCPPYHGQPNTVADECCGPWEPACPTCGRTATVTKVYLGFCVREL